MSRRQVIGFVVVFALIAAGLVFRATRSGHGADLSRLRAAAALQPCPTGLGPQLPAIALDCLGGGRAVRLRAGVQGRPVLVNVWATWCGPCVREVPALVAFAAKAGDRVGVVGVDTEDEDAKALTFAEQYGMHYPSVVDPDGRVLRAYGSGPPITLLLDAQGRVRFRHQGELTSTAQIEQLVQTHLGVQL